MAATAGLRSPPRAATEVRFKEIAHHTGLSLLRSPIAVKNPPKALRSAPAVEDQLPATPGMEPPNAMQESGEPGQVHTYGKSERLRRELEWLKAEQKAESDHLRKLENCLSDSFLLEKRAKARIQKHQEQVTAHSQRTAEVEKRMGAIKDQLAAADGVPRREKRAVGLQTPGVSQPPSREARGIPSAESSVGFGNSTQPRLGLLAQSAHRAAGLGGSASAPQLPPGSPGSSFGSPMAGVPRSASPLSGSVPQHWPAVTDLEASPAMAADCGFQQQQQRSCPNTGSSMGPATPPRRRPPQRTRALSESSVNLGGGPDQGLTEEEKETLNEARRIRVREDMKEKAGSCRAAFKALDLNGSGSISSQEFADGITRMGVNWQQLTGLKRPRELFCLFDEDRKFAISFQGLFPEESRSNTDRPSTPDFYRAYVRMAKKHSGMEEKPLWSPSTSEDKLKIMYATSAHGETGAEKKKWIRSTMRRLKTRGKSDGRCREVVALHLPRGSGPKDGEGVSTFSQVDLKNCKRVYNEEINVPMRRMWKTIGEYKDQRQQQKGICSQLFAVTEEKKKHGAEEALAHITSGLSLFGKKEQPDEQRPNNSAGSARNVGGLGSRNSQLFRWLAEECDATEEDVESVYKDYVKFADTGEMMGKRGFTRLLQSLLSHRALEDSESDVWWEQVQQVPISEPSAEGRPGSSGHEEGASSAAPSLRRTQCTFEQFCIWWAESAALQECEERKAAANLSAYL